MFEFYGCLQIRKATLVILAAAPCCYSAMIISDSHSLVAMTQQEGYCLFFYCPTTNKNTNKNTNGNV